MKAKLSFRKALSHAFHLLLAVMTGLLAQCQPVAVIAQASTPHNDSAGSQVLPTPTQIYIPLITQAPPIPPLQGYFFDSVGGSDSNAGTSPTEAWRSLSKFNSTNFKPGEVVYFKRGSSWSGSMIIDTSGTRENPIVFTSYGDSGEAPTFANPSTSGRLTNAIKITADWVILEKVKVTNARLSGVYIETGADYNIVRNIEATQVGEGINVHGQHNKILNNYLHDLTMVNNTQGGSDDYGAVGVWLFNHYNEVAYNQMINCKAPSYDYEYDGGAVEMYREVNGSYIHHNYSYNAQGFTEIGGGAAYDNIIAYNVIVDSGRVVGIHLSGGFASDVKNLRIENNTVVDTTPEGFAGVVLFFGGSPNPEMVILRNNIFYLENYDRIANKSNFTHENNLYYIPHGSLGFTATPNEIRADPLFIDLGAGDYRLQASSPAIDRALDLGYTIDYNARPVPVGDAPDMGAFEYQPAAD